MVLLTGLGLGLTLGVTYSGSVVTQLYWRFPLYSWLLLLLLLWINSESCPRHWSLQNQHINVLLPWVLQRCLFVVSWTDVTGYRLANTKCMTDIELWKKILHPNLVQLREVFTTKAFSDNCTWVFAAISFQSGLSLSDSRHFTPQSVVRVMSW